MSAFDDERILGLAEMLDDLSTALERTVLEPRVSDDQLTDLFVLVFDASDELAQLVSQLTTLARQMLPTGWTPPDFLPPIERW